METWTWLLGALVGFVLLQLSLYRYLMRSTTTESPEATTPVPEGGTAPVDTATELPEEELVVCTGCGAYNESHATFSFCRECGDRLP